MVTIQKHDFVEIEYTGRLAESGAVFDTSDEATAKQNGIFQERMTYGPVTICVGEGHILAGLDKNIEGKELGTHTFHLTPEDGFGRKNAKLLKLVPASVFRKQDVGIMPGMQVNVDGMMGIVRTATGGRVIVDFNHPLSGKDIIYEVKVHRIVTDKAEQVKAVIKMMLSMPAQVVIAGDAAEVTLEQELPPEIGKQLDTKILELTKLISITIKAAPKPVAKQEAGTPAIAPVKDQ